VAQTLGAHALLLVVDDVPGSEHIGPGKVFEYIGARRPVVAVGPEGAVADLVRRTRAGSVVVPTDVEGIARAIDALYREWLATGTTVFPGDAAQVERQSRRERTRELAEVLTQVLEERHGSKG
jgi:hypothetical protein